MQIVIDIPEDTAKEIKDNAMFAESIASQIKWDVTGAIVNGTPIPDNATNGQVIRTLFKPNRVERTDDDVIVENYDFSKEWWNSPYQKGGKDEVN